MEQLDSEKEWEGVLYRVFLVQQGKTLFNDYDYSNQWGLLEEAMEKDLHDEEVFVFTHPKNSKKAYKRSYHLCPANGNARMVIGKMQKPLDFAYVFFVLHSHIFKVPYIVLERHRRISPNPDYLAGMVAQSVNWILKDYGVKIVLKRWEPSGQKVSYRDDFWISYNIELEKSKGKNLIPMGYEGALKVHEEIEAKREKCKRAASIKKTDDIRFYIQHPNKDAIITFIHKALEGMKMPKDIARPIRVLVDHQAFSKDEGYRLPFRAFIKECPEVKDMIKAFKYNDWTNPNRKSYNNDHLYKKLEREFETII